MGIIWSIIGIFWSIIGQGLGHRSIIGRDKSIICMSQAPSEVAKQPLKNDEHLPAHYVPLDGNDGTAKFKEGLETALIALDNKNIKKYHLQHWVM